MQQTQVKSISVTDIFTSFTLKLVFLHQKLQIFISLHSSKMEYRNTSEFITRPNTNLNFPPSASEREILTQKLKQSLVILRSPPDTLHAHRL